MRAKNAFYAQSGGVSAVINASACAVPQTVRQYAAESGKVYCLGSVARSILLGIQLLKNGASLSGQKSLLRLTRSRRSNGRE
jgi:hypothetical protein